MWRQLQQFERINLSYNNLTEVVMPSTLIFRTSSLQLNHNGLNTFPQLNAKALEILDLCYNNIAAIPNGITASLPNLKWLNVSHNKLENVPTELAILQRLIVNNNPLSQIPPVYRYDDKLLYYLKMIHLQPAMLPWKQIKLMLMGQENVGKTTLVCSLQNSKYKCATNTSTNGVNITTLNLPAPSKFLFFQRIKEPGIQFNIWDFGGQSVFHSTHRFFVTSNALYVILYDMSKPDTIQRVKYWIEQVKAINRTEGARPILIVGTHADKLSQQDQLKISSSVQEMYPVSTSLHSSNQVLGHCTISITSAKKQGLLELEAMLVNIALTHPTIGIKQAQVPRNIALLQNELAEQKKYTPYLRWKEYANIGIAVGIEENFLCAAATILHDGGSIVWHNIPKLCDVVIINPQWFADAMAGVVTFIHQSEVVKNSGTTNWLHIREILKLTFKNLDIQEVILSLLEFFEVIYKLRINKSVAKKSLSKLSDEQMFFIPSLLLPFESKLHPSIQHWNQIKAGQEFTRRFSWSFFPAGFFPCLLLRLKHLNVVLLACWLNVAVIMGSCGTEWAVLELSKSLSQYCLEVTVKSENFECGHHEPLVSVLSYVISRLHRYMYITPQSEVPIVHEVVTCVRNCDGEEYFKVLRFEDCMQMLIKGCTHVDIHNAQVQIDNIIPDLSSCPAIPITFLIKEEKLGEGAFGVVYKAKMLYNNHFLEVALKELQDDSHIYYIYDFQHEIAVMSKLNHQNLVKLHGITKYPLQMVLEFVPNSDLHSVLRLNGRKISEKWKLKLAVDCAVGMEYLHSQSPPICHSDLRVPNIFVVTLDEEGLIIGKIADFGLSQQVFSHSQQTLYNITETAPETWGDVRFYDEKSDIYSFAIILWRLFGANSLYSIPSQSDNLVEESKEEYEDYLFLKINGRFPPPPQQREIIRKGGRPDIHRECPECITSLIKMCWNADPNERPLFPTIFESLIAYYISKYSEDEYVIHKKKLRYSMPDLLQKELVDYQELSFSPEMWNIYIMQEKTTVTSMADTGSDIWIGTSSNYVVVANRETCQLMQTITFQGDISSSQTRGITVLKVDHFVWVSFGSEIRIFSAKTIREVTLPLFNIWPILSMVLIPEALFVWVTDSAGYVSIWDAKLLQKCYRFQIHASNCTQDMCLLNDFVWMAVGRDLAVVNSKTMQTIKPQTVHNDRIHHIIAVPQTNQVWTCARDGSLKAWKLENTEQEEHQITLVHEWKMEVAVKSLCTMVGGIHVCAGAFDGSVSMWNVHDFQQTEIPMHESAKSHSVQCVLDTETALWCGLVSSTQPLMCHPHIKKQ